MIQYSMAGYSKTMLSIISYNIPFLWPPHKMVGLTLKGWWNRPCIPGTDKCIFSLPRSLDASTKEATDTWLGRLGRNKDGATGTKGSLVKAGKVWVKWVDLSESFLGYILQWWDIKLSFETSSKFRYCQKSYGFVPNKTAVLGTRHSPADLCFMFHNYCTRVAESFFIMSPFFQVQFIIHPPFLHHSLHQGTGSVTETRETRPPRSWQFFCSRSSAASSKKSALEESRRRRKGSGLGGSRAATGAWEASAAPTGGDGKALNDHETWWKRMKTDENWWKLVKTDEKWQWLEQDLQFCK